MKNIINIENYEAFWVDYLDGNLNIEEEEKLFQFLENNQNIASQLIDTDSYVIPAFDATFPDKYKLVAENQIDNLIIAKIENEINKEEDKFITELIDTNPEIKKDYQLYKKTILKADCSIICPYKNIILKNNRKKIYRFTAYLIAASFTLIAAAGLYLFTDITGSEQQSPALAVIINNDIKEPKLKKEILPQADEVSATYYDNTCTQIEAESYAKPFSGQDVNKDLLAVTNVNNTTNTLLENEKNEPLPQKAPVTGIEKIGGINNDEEFVFMEYRIDFPEDETLYTYTIEYKKSLAYDEQEVSGKKRIKNFIKKGARKFARLKNDFDLQETFEKIIDTREEFLTTNKK